MRCECDLQLARRLAEHEDEWNVDYHRRWGENPFNPRESCRPPAQSTTEEPTTLSPTTLPEYSTGTTIGITNEDGSVEVNFYL